MYNTGAERSISQKYAVRPRFVLLLSGILTGVNQTTIADIKKKRNNSVNLRIIFELCQGLGIEIVEFFDSPLFKTDNIDV